MAKEHEVSRSWHLVNAEGEILGRVAARIAQLLQGKHKPLYTPHVDCGDHVVVVNAGKVRVTGTKMQTKVYRRYTGYPGGLREESLERLLERRPEEVLRRAVAGMMPKNPLGQRMAKKLHIYTGPSHPHVAQLKSIP